MDNNILFEVYNEILPDCICKNWDNKPYMLAVTAKKWALDSAINLCKGRANEDPIEILTGYLWDLMIMKMDCHNDDAKLVFGKAVDIVQELIDTIKYRTKL